MARVRSLRSREARPTRRELAQQVERFLLRFLREPLLWPVLLVLVAHAAAFAGALLIFALREQQAAAWLGLAVTAATSAAFPALEWGLRRRLGALTALAAVTWLLAAALAWAADRWQLF